MQLTATIIQLLPLQHGLGKTRSWIKQEVIVETDSPNPKKICVSIWGDKIDENQLKIGNRLNIEFEIESREFNGKWYTNLTVLNTKLIVSADADHTATSFMGLSDLTEEMKQEMRDQTNDLNDEDF